MDHAPFPTAAALDPHRADEISALLAVAAEGTFAAAGLLLQRHPSVVSRRLAAMERRLGVRLIERTTRQLRVTDAGQALVAQLRTALRLMADAEQEAARGAAEVRGVLRLALPAAMGRRWIGPLLPDFLAAHPQIAVVADYRESFVDLIAEGFDAAVRIGELHDNRLVARKLCDHRRIVCAAPAYLARHGHPAVPADLARHNCLRFTEFSSFPQWRLSDGAREERLAPRGSLTSNDAESLLAAARAGVGILGAGEWLLGQDLAAGTLVRVLPDWQLDASGTVALVRPSAQHAPATVTAFRDWIVARFSPAPPWRRASPAD